MSDSPQDRGALDVAIDRAARDLPDGMSIAIEVGRNAGWVELRGVCGLVTKRPGSNGELAEQVHQTIDIAIAAMQSK